MNKHFLLIVLLFCSSILFSQTNTGSPYSINELGEINFSGNVSNLSMGGIDVKIDSNDIPKYIFEADLVIAGGGYTKLEAAYLKTPLLCLPVHRHQEKLIQY